MATIKGEMISRNPSEIAKRLLAYFEAGPVAAPADLYTEPHVVRHAYEGFDKLKYLQKPVDPNAPPFVARFTGSEYTRVAVIDGDGAVTVLLTTKVTTFQGKQFFMEAAMVHLLNADGKIFRVEAYYDPRDLERDGWIQDHLKAYDGIVEP